MAPSTRIAYLALAAAAACATLGEPQAPPGPPAFQGVRTVALVRWVDDPGRARPKDPLDALQESLAARGFATRVVELGPRRRDPGDVYRLFERVEGRVSSGAPSGRPGRRIERVGADAARAALAAVSTDAMAAYHRLVGVPMLAPLPPPTDPLDPLAPLPGGLYPSRSLEPPYRPLGAISLVDRDGNLVWFDWGTPPSIDLGAPANAAEAVDAALRALSGQPEEEQ